MNTPYGNNKYVIEKVGLALEGLVMIDHDVVMGRKGSRVPTYLEVPI